MKHFILDTNVIIQDPDCISKFGEDNTVVIYQVVIDELDHLKKGMTTKAFASRNFSRTLLDLREHGSLQDGVKIEDGPIVRVMQYTTTFNSSIPTLYEHERADNMILEFAAGYLMNPEAEISEGDEVILVTNDANMIFKADAMGINAQVHQNSIVDISAFYDVQKVFSWDELGPDQWDAVASNEPFKNTFGLEVNEYAIIGEVGHRCTVIRCYGDEIRVVPPIHNSVFGIRPKNDQQRMAFDALLDPSITCVALVGPAGTGKTLCAMACAFGQSIDGSEYKKTILARPVVPMGRDIGYLPGNMQDKIAPYMAPFEDNLQVLMPDAVDKMVGSSGLRELQDQGFVELQVLTYIRGRSIPNHIIIIDEAQQLSQHEIKTILTRAGDNSKIIFCGDPYQIDDPYMSSKNCGMSHVINRFKNKPNFAKVVMTIGERSALAEMAAELL